MVDSLILTQLSKHIKIGDVTYHVAWDSQDNRALILCLDDPVDDYTPQLYELPDANGDAMTFASELDAHRYLVGLYYENKDKDFSWTQLI